MCAKSFIVFSLIVAVWAARASEKLPVLNAGSEVYSNVTITKVTATDIYFTCSGGMANVKLGKLDPALQKHFGYDPVKASEVEQKHVQDNAQYHSQIIHQPASQPAPVDSKNAPAQTASGTYGDVPSKYRDTTITKTGDAAPVSSLHTIDNQNVDFRGKVVVLDFFATWCGPCMEEMPYLEKYVSQRFKDKGLIVVAVGRGHSISDLEKFQKQKGFSLLFAADPQEECFRKFATQYIPRCVLIGKDGRIKLQTIGFSTDDIYTLVKGVANELQK